MCLTFIQPILPLTSSKILLFCKFLFPLILPQTLYINVCDSPLCLSFQCFFPQRWLHLELKILGEKYGTFFNSFHSMSYDSYKDLNRSTIKLGRSKVTVLFNQTCFKEKMQHTHTHTHTHI